MPDPEYAKRAMTVVAMLYNGDIESGIKAAGDGPRLSWTRMGGRNGGYDPETRTNRLSARAKERDSKHRIRPVAILGGRNAKQGFLDYTRQI